MLCLGYKAKQMPVAYATGINFSVELNKAIKLGDYPQQEH